MASACPECGYLFDGPISDHQEVCEARTCVACETVFHEVVPENAQGDRVCVSCQRDLQEADTEDSGMEDAESEGEGAD